MQRCGTCSAAQLPPEVVCTSCQSRDLGWHEVPPTGTLTSFTKVWHPLHPGLVDRIPYLVAVVEIAPGARLVGNILGDPDRTDLRFDMPMQAVFEDHAEQGVTLIQWLPA